MAHFIEHKIQQLIKKYDLQTLPNFGYHNSGCMAFLEYKGYHIRLHFNAKNPTFIISFIHDDFRNHPKFETKKAYTRIAECSKFAYFKFEDLQRVGRTYKFKQENILSIMEDLFKFLDTVYKEIYGTDEFPVCNINYNQTEEDTTGVILDAVYKILAANGINAKIQLLEVDK